MIPNLHSRTCLSFMSLLSFYDLSAREDNMRGLHRCYPGGQCRPAWQISVYKIRNRVLCKQRLALGATGTTNAAYKGA
jgi:hypothetical protein